MKEMKRKERHKTSVEGNEMVANEGNGEKERKQEAE